VQRLELTASFLRTEVLAGESVPITVSISNRGDVPAKVHSSDSESPFVFQLLPAGNGPAMYTLSQRQSQLVQGGGEPLPRYTPPMEELAPGATVQHENDLADFATKPILPGRYRVVAHYEIGGQEFASPPVELAVVVPRIEILAGLVSPLTGSLALAFSHRAADGATIVFQRESETRNPDLGVSLRCVERGAGALIAGLSQAIELEDAPGRRWLAWLEGDRIGATMTSMIGRPSSLDPIPVGLTAPRLLPVGRKHDDGRVVFLVAGGDRGGPAVKEVTFSARAAPGTRVLGLGAAAVPEELQVHYRRNGTDADVSLVWAEVSGGKVSLFRRSFGPGQSGMQGEYKKIFERAGSLLSLDMSPFGIDTISLLLAPAGESRKILYVRIPLFDEKNAVEDSIVVPKENVEEWAVAAASADLFRIIARAGDRLLRLAPGAASWDVVTAGARDARHLRLYTLPGGRFCAVWDDPQEGIRFQPIQ